MSDTTEPTYTCKICARRRSCRLHLRAEFPPDAAKHWLKKTCSTPTRCDLEYRAGIQLPPPERKE